jgi:peptidoglycan/LPS O-acetylase OafA/YrhL
MWAYQPGTTKRVFYQRRFARVYPAYAVMCLVAIPVVWIIEGYEAPVHLLQALLPFTLLQAWIPHYRFAYGGNGVSWSLSCEAFFYAMFPFLVGPIVRAGRTAQFAVVGLCIAVPWVVAIALWPTDSQSWRALAIYTNPLARIFEFICGMALAALFRQGLRVPWLRMGPVLALAAVAYVIAGRVPFALQAVPITIVPFSLLIFAAAQADVAGRTPRLLAARWMITLGQWSYAFYLVHQLVLRVFRYLRADPSQPNHAEAIVFSVAAYVISIVLAALLFRFVEQPLERRLRPRRLSGQRVGGTAP